MKKVSLIVFSLFSLSLLIPNAHAAPMLYRIQQMKEQKQKQAQQQYQAEYQQYQQPSQQAAQAPQLTPEQQYDNQVDARNQAIAKAISGADVSGVSTPVSATNTPSPSMFPGSGDTVDLTEVWKKLDNKSAIWTAIDDNQAKVMTVTEYISRFQKEGVTISAPPQHYVQMIDQMSQQNPQMLQRPFGELLQMMAIIDYDFDNGMDKDMLARKVLGDQGYAANQQRIQQAQQESQQQAAQPQGGGNT